MQPFFVGTASDIDDNSMTERYKLQFVVAMMTIKI
jgi:hypothetical protein